MQRVTSKSALGASTAARALLSLDQSGKLFTRRQESRKVNTGSFSGASMPLAQYPLVRGGEIYWGNHSVFDSRSYVAFIRGPIRGQKRAFCDLVTGIGTRLPHSRVAYDTFHKEPYFFTSTGARFTSQNVVNSVGGSPIGFTFHEELGRSIVVNADKTIVTSTNSRSGHTAATLPSLVGVAFGASAVIGKTPTHVLVPTGDIRSGSAGFLRSTDGTTYTLIGGITAITLQPAVTFAEFIDGRLWLCTDRGLWSSEDNGTTWRNDIAQTVRLSFIGRRANGGLIAIGDGIWHAPAGGGFSQVTTSDFWLHPIAYVPEQRLIYSGNDLYSEKGDILLSASSFDVSSTAVRGYGAYGSGMSAFTLVPDTDATILIYVAGSSYAHFVRCDFGLYVPPETGVEVEILAIGGGGTDSVQATNGKDTVVANLALAAGGSHGNVASYEVSTGVPGDWPVLKTIGGGGNTSFYGVALYEAKGGPGFLIRGQEFGAGKTLTMHATFAASSSPTFSVGSATSRGGFSGASAIWRGRVTDPIPMSIGGSIEGYGSHFGRSQAGAVVILEI
jgi:hypothetical protein